MTPVAVAAKAVARSRIALAGAPTEYCLPAERPTLDEAKAWCRNLATTHYENFHVATWFLPKRVRPHFESVYAYCRVSDDLGDEVADSTTALRLLDEWGAMLDECYDSPEQSRHPVFVALHETIAAHDLPRHLFHDLLTAFKLDQTKTRFGSIAELEEYSRDSANPVGRLVLLVSGYREDRITLLSDKICTALQLANFWQDVVEDWERGRRYLPGDLMRLFGVTDAGIAARKLSPEFRALMEHLVMYTRQMLREGGEISGLVDRELATTLDLFRKGGESILDAIAAQGYDTLKRRPEVSKARKARLLAGGSVGQGGWSSGLSPMDAEQGTPPAVAAAYETCQSIARREAKNFYYAFRVLPKHKRNAMCAIYAFMRRADDISDDETQFLEERRETMAEWLAAWRLSTIEDNDPVFVAVRDTQRRFGISDDLLEQLVQGTSMDLYPEVSWHGKTPVYADFDALYRYCYLVASVVGLVCIRIFGYSDPRAERLAEETGIAFQLTNILRDVSEDATRNRIYLPMDLMAGYGLTVERVWALAEGAPMISADRDMLRAMGEKAEAYYGSAERLLPLIDKDSRAALWVLVTIYRGLLRRIAAADYDVFSHRASVPRAAKIFVLAQGAARALGNRLIG